ncbi:MAG: hypothetical protein LC795_10015 [Acidobacteria bacterium]|nr:hypothetical protein [Acidobacteriota bacterium]
MKTTLYALLILALPFVPHGASATTGENRAAPHAVQTAEDGAKKYDEFGDVLVTDWLARLDGFAVELQNNPGAKGYVVAYIAPNKSPGWPLRRASWARGYLVRGRGLGEERVEVFNGGYSDAAPRYELWVVRPGANLPVKPFDYGAELSREKRAYLFDRYAYFDLSPDDTGIESGYIGYLDQNGLYAPFAEALRLDPAARGFVIAYRTRRDRRDADRRLASRVKLGILKSHALDAGRVVTLGGGVRTHRIVELWIVPPGAPPPRPTPDPTPARRRRR